jgi:hypothetical protein
MLCLLHQHTTVLLPAPPSCLCRRLHHSSSRLRPLLGHLGRARGINSHWPTPSAPWPYSSSNTAQIQYICCFTLMILSSPHPVQHFCSRPYLPSSKNSQRRISDPSIISWESLYNIRRIVSSSLSINLLSIFLSELVWWTASQF